MPARVLVADDEPGTLRCLLSHLRRAGIRAVGAAGGREALSVADALPPRVAVVDAIMTDVHGLEVCRRLKAAETTRDAAVLIMTGNACDDAFYKKSLEAGALECLWKPLDPGALVRKVRSLLDAPAPAPARTLFPQAPVHALLVEDDEGSRHFWSEALAAEGFTLDHAGSAEEALRTCRAAPPDAVLTDVTLPGRLDGLGLVRSLRASPPDVRALPVAVLTATDTPACHAEALGAGADDFFPKHTPPSYVAALLRARLARVWKSVSPRGVRRGPDYLDRASGTFYGPRTPPVRIAPQEAAVLMKLMESELGCDVAVLAEAGEIAGEDEHEVTHRVREIVRRLRVKLPRGEEKLLTRAGGYGWFP